MCWGLYGHMESSSHNLAILANIGYSRNTSGVTTNSMSVNNVTYLYHCITHKSNYYAVYDVIVTHWSAAMATTAFYRVLQLYRPALARYLQCSV